MIYIILYPLVQPSTIKSSTKAFWAYQCFFSTDSLLFFRQKKIKAADLEVKGLFKDALETYDDLVNWLKDSNTLNSQHPTPREISEIYLGRSSVNLNLDNVDAALNDAKKCVKTDIKWYKVSILGNNR